MINANELRIGNWLQRLDGSYFRVKASDILNLSSWKSEYLKPQPIHLTEEILLQCGFEKHIDVSGIYYELNKHRVYLFDDFFEFEYTYTGENRINLFKKFKYLHQLQNLIYTLTDNELEINL